MSLLRFELFIATRYLRAKRRQAVIGVITAISIIGVAAGVASLIIALAINNGFRSDLQARLLGSMSHINLMRVQSDGIRNWQELLARLTKQPHVVAGAPAIYEEVLISRGARAQGALLKGILPAEERKVSDLLDNVKFGSADSTRLRQDIPKARRKRSPIKSPNLCPPSFSAKTWPTPSALPSAPSCSSPVRKANSPPSASSRNISALKSSGSSNPASTTTTLPGGSPASATPSNSSDSTMSSPSSNSKSMTSTRLPPSPQELEKAAGQGFGSKNWMEQNQALFRALRLEKVVTFITIGLIVFVAALNILISLIMMVMEKTKDIAVLVSIGARRQQIRRIFMLQGVLVGVIGTLIGLVLGFSLAIAAGHYHWIRLSAEVYSIDYVPFAPRLIDGIIVALVSVAISFIATIYPAMNASRVLPAEALRYE